MTDCLPFDDTIDLQLTLMDDEDLLPAQPNSDLATVSGGMATRDMDISIREVDSLISNDELSRSSESNLPEVIVTSRTVVIGRVRGYIIVAVLCLVNLLNYMDRFTIAGLLRDIKSEFHGLSDTESGLLQTSFICIYMIASPVFGYLGDRYVRKYLMMVGIIFWCIVTFASSFIPGNMFWLFVVFRGLVGMGEASYSTVAPTLIADLFTGDKRKLMLMLFYFAIPVGSGLGYVVGTSVAKAFGDWRYGLRVTPFLGIACVIVLFLFVVEPQRGAAEGGESIRNTSWLQDIKALFKNKSFMLSSGGVTCVAFVTGALAFWAPTFMIDAHNTQALLANKTVTQGSLVARIGLIFGGITVCAGFIGVALGTEAARRYKKLNPRADPLVCAFGMLSCTPFLFFSLYMAEYNTAATWVLIFMGETMLCLNWAVVADILLYVVVPTRRSTAEAFQILMSHLLGDAGSPFLVGEVSDRLKPHFHGDNAFTNFKTLQYAMYITTFACIIGGGLFLFTALFVQRDKAVVDRALEAAHESRRDKELTT